ncbi:hypothetical protein [Tsukamurella pulmonis]|uniref:hypothetical protein n=1 Tax=Tsukamurella pulmonis TaxID=47312 RepID=UPI000E0987B0|nr:hypothetical protein [Tsukamurella pulmonis]RDH11544.1 hypothetical protein DVB88_12165 [Tsukamurella pulmonis]
MPPEQGERARLAANPFVTLRAQLDASKPKDNPMVSPTLDPGGVENTAGQDPILPLAPRDLTPPKLSKSDATDEAERVAKCQQCDPSGFAYDLVGQRIRCTHGRTISTGGAADHA